MKYSKNKTGGLVNETCYGNKGICKVQCSIKLFLGRYLVASKLTYYLTKAYFIPLKKEAKPVFDRTINLEELNEALKKE